ESARADFIAADLLAQAEHAEDACSVLITTSEQLANEVVTQLALQTQELSRRTIAEESLAQYGTIFIVKNLDEAVEIANELAPEHLQLVTNDDEALSVQVGHAGAIFSGSYSPEVVGEYFFRPHHVLPTARAARFASAPG